MTLFSPAQCAPEFAITSQWEKEKERIDRVRRGGCPCGEAKGLDKCSLCDNPAIPDAWKDFEVRWRIDQHAKGAAEKLRALLKKLDGEQRQNRAAARTVVVNNRFTRRRAASRKWARKQVYT